MDLSVIPIFSDDSGSVFNFQQCTSSYSLIEDIPGFELIFESYASIECWEINSSPNTSRFQFLNRLSRGRSGGDGPKLIKCNQRVLEILIVDKIEKEHDFNMNPPLELELALAEQIIRMRKNSPDSDDPMNFDFDNLVTSTEKIRLLKSGPIKSMTITVITSSYPGRNSDLEKLARTFGTILQTNDIRVRPRTIVDLRDCPLSKSFEWNGFISAEFIFINQCQFKHSDSLIGRVNSQTNITIDRVHHEDYYTRLVESSQCNKSDIEYDFAGVECVFEKLRDNVTLQKLCKGEQDVDITRALLVAGPSGSGKTRAVCKAAKVLQANLLMFQVATSKILSSKSKDADRGSSNRSTSLFSTASALNEVFVKAIQSGNMYPTILLIEGLELLHSVVQTPSGKGRKNEASKQKENLVSDLCQVFDSIPTNCSLTIVATTDKPHLIHPRLRICPRFHQEVTINVPVENVRLKILQSLTRQNPLFETANMKSIAERTPGFVSSDLVRLTHRIFLKMKDEKCNSVSELHVKYALAHVFPSALQGTVGVVDIQRVTSLDHIVGLPSVKFDLIKAIIWPLRFPDAFLRMGIQPSKGILLYGPPGCGKTTLVRALAASHQTNFLSVSAAELFSSGVGDSEKIVAHLFHRARMASPCILFLDELDSVVGARVSDNRGKSNSVNDTILTMLLTEMDGIGIRIASSSGRSKLGEEERIHSPQVIVVGATNRPELIDSALLRPGRFDRLIAIPPPDEAGRLEFLRKSTERTPIAEDVDLEKLARETVGYSGSDLEKLVREAALCALAEDMNRSSVSMDHYIKAKAEQSPSLSLEYLRSFYEYSSTTTTSESSIPPIHQLTNDLNSLRI